MKIIISLAVTALLASACASMGVGGGPSAVANLDPTTGNAAKGTVSFSQHGDNHHSHTAPDRSTASSRSASMAAMQPEPAAVTAWRYSWSCTSPQA